MALSGLRGERLSVTGYGTQTREYPAWISKALDLIAALQDLPNPPSCYASDEARAEIVNSSMATMPEVSAVEQDGEVMVKIHWPRRRMLVIGYRYHHSS